MAAHSTVRKHTNWCISLQTAHFCLAVTYNSLLDKSGATCIQEIGNLMISLQVSACNMSTATSQSEAVFDNSCLLTCILTGMSVSCGMNYPSAMRVNVQWFQHGAWMRDNLKLSLSTHTLNPSKYRKKNDRITQYCMVFFMNLGWYFFKIQHS